MSICEGCGFISYPDVTKEYLDEYYKKDYRKPPTVINLDSCQRKNQYHAIFLNDVFNKWKKDKKQPVVCDVGAAFGAFLALVKKVFPTGDVYGAELTESFVRVAKHFYNIDLSKEIDTTKKHDLISSYKVLEHQLDPLEELKKYAACLKPDGLLYISVPTWFNFMENFGAGGWDIEYYYSKNHINVWTREHFENLLQVAGFDIIQYNGVYYGDTYLCKLKDEPNKVFLQKINPDKIKSNLEKVYAASKFYAEGEFIKAIDTWERFPEAWRNYYELNREMFHRKGFDRIEKEYIEQLIKACPKHSDAMMFIGELYMRYRMYNEAIKAFELVLQLKPQAPGALLNISHCCRAVGNIPKAIEVTRFLEGVSNQMSRDCINWLFNDFSKCPIEEENNENNIQSTNKCISEDNKDNKLEANNPQSDKGKPDSGPKGKSKVNGK